MASTMEDLLCPFCDFTNKDSYSLLQHVELIHPENGESPFIVRDDGRPSRAYHSEDEETTPQDDQRPLSRNSKDKEYVECPYDCGELVLSAELSSHQDFHVAEGMALAEAGLPSGAQLTGRCNDTKAVRNISDHFATDIPKSLRNLDQRGPSTPPRNYTKKRSPLKDLLLGSPSSPRRRGPVTSEAVTDGGTRRLGRAELGPYAHEKQMPTWLRRMLEEGARVTITNQIGPNGVVVRVEAVANETPGLVPVLARLSDLDPSVERAFYCSSEVRHVAKMPKEGGFCGYRNIQMLISYIHGAKALGHEHFQDRVPSILKLQDLIEQAWDMGYNSAGKIETGGIRLTRKYIGTPEAQALFLSLAIRCEANAFTRSGGLVSHEALLLAVGEYFSNDRVFDLDEKVVMTDKPPIYFQHQGHSMTIIGLEVKNSGAVNLVVFDPMFNPSPAIKRLVGSNSFRTQNPERLLRAHRRGESYLGRYRAFEILKLATPAHREINGGVT